MPTGLRRWELGRPDFRRKRARGRAHADGAVLRVSTPVAFRRTPVAPQSVWASRRREASRRRAALGSGWGRAAAGVPPGAGSAARGVSGGLTTGGSGSLGSGGFRRSLSASRAARLFAPNFESGPPGRANVTTSNTLLAAAAAGSVCHSSQ